MMDAPALCDSILQFVGSSLPAQGNTSNLPVADLADEAAGERLSEGDTAQLSSLGSAHCTGSTAAAACGAEQQRLQQQGLMRAFMGNKLGEFNMRGVEAGMGMVNVTNRRTGKLLNSGRRQRREEQNTPYGRRSSSRGEKNKYMDTQTKHPQSGDAQVASTNAASSRGASSQAESTATTQLGTSVGGAGGSVGVDSSRSAL